MLPTNNDDQVVTKGSDHYHKSAGGFVFFDDKSKNKLFVALIKPVNEEGLFVPKGHLKAGEDTLTAALREICEELSLKKQPTLVGEVGVSKYLYMSDDGVTRNFKEVSLFVFGLDTKESIKGSKSEMVDQALWVEFEDACNKLAYDRENLIKARQIFNSSNLNRK